MRFDRFELAFDGNWEDTPGSGKPLATDGTHAAQITRVRDWRSGEGVTVTLEIDGEEFAPVDLLMAPATERGHKAAVRLLAALGIEGGEIDGDLVGRRVQIVTKQGVNKKDDTPMVYVNGIKPYGEPESVEPPPPAKAERKAPARTAAQKVQAAKGEDAKPLDDIPF